MRGYRTDEVVTVETPLGHKFELEVSCDWQRAEPDVGIMGDYVDDFHVTAVNGSTRHARWVDKIVARDEKLADDIVDMIHENN